MILRQEVTMRRLNLTKRIIQKLPTPSDLRVDYRDTRVPGLGIGVQTTGSRVFFWFRRVRGQRTWRSLGNFPAFSVEQARGKAQELNVIIGKWKASGYIGPSPLGRR